MLTLNVAKPTRPERVVIMGAGGFVGRASLHKLQVDGVNAVALTRKEVDLLAGSAGQKLAAQLTSTTTLLVTSALAPVKNTAMLLDNLRMMQAVIEAVKATPVAHLIYISSDAVYADSDQPMTESSPAGPSSLHGVMHLAWIDRGDGRYQGQMTVYVKPRGPLGKGYMALIKPFRYLIVYPALMRQIERDWNLYLTVRVPPIPAIRCPGTEQ